MAVTEGQNAADGAQPGGAEAVASGESELDTLLKEYETDRTPETKPERGDVRQVVKALQPVVEYARNSMAKDQADAVQGDLDTAFKFVTETDGLKTLEPDDVRGFLEAYGANHPDFAKAFENRSKNPEAWTEALGKGRDWMTERFAKFSSSTDRGDIEAAQAAVTGTTDQVPDSKDGPSSADMFAMSDTKWESYMESELDKAG
ncbi:hypothetical protein LCGC14_0747420 [marine sediment metagenome]|uniref:Uncharacterized protein n=1 Tax=marine sediment metagenome TaxID=412755 RepID=A0A0F9QPV5_9ZZZZ